MSIQTEIKEIEEEREIAILEFDKRLRSRYADLFNEMAVNNPKIGDVFQVQSGNEDPCCVLSRYCTSGDLHERVYYLTGLHGYLLEPYSNGPYKYEELIAYLKGRSMKKIGKMEAKIVKI